MFRLSVDSKTSLKRLLKNFDKTERNNGVLFFLFIELGFAAKLKLQLNRVNSNCSNPL
jgi:hypothetical protein